MALLIVPRIIRYGDKNESCLKPSPVTDSSYRGQVKAKTQQTEKAAVRLVLERCLDGRSRETKSCGTLHQESGGQCLCGRSSSKRKPLPRSSHRNSLHPRRPKETFGNSAVTGSTVRVLGFRSFISAAQNNSAVND